MKRILAIMAFLGVGTLNFLNAEPAKLTIVSADDIAVFKVTGATLGAFYNIEESPDLKNWFLVTPATDVAGTDFTAAVPIVFGFDHRFYRYHEFKSSFVIASDPSSPSFQFGAGGTLGVTSQVIKIRAEGESGFLFRLPLKLTSGSDRDLVFVNLLNSNGEQVGQAIFTGSSTWALSTFVQPLFLSEDRGTVLTMKLDLSTVGPSAPGIAGDIIKVDYDGSQTNPDLQALVVGVKSGRRIPLTGGTQAAGMELVKSFPSLAIGWLPNYGAADGRFLRFAMTANSSGSVSLAKLTAQMVTQNVSISKVGLYAFTDSAYTEPVSGFGAGGELCATNISLSSGNATIPLYCRYFDGSLGELQVPAGATQYFEIRGVVTLTGTTAFVVASLLQDTVQPEPIMNGFSTLDKGGRNFIWSGNSFTTSQLTTVDWTSGYAVPGLTGIIQVRGN